MSAQALLLNDFLSTVELEFVLESLRYVLNAYNVDDPRSLEAVESVRDMIADTPEKVELSTFQLFCSLKLVQVYVNDVVDEPGYEHVKIMGNMVLSHLVHAGTQGARFKVDNQGEPLTDEDAEE